MDINLDMSCLIFYSEHIFSLNSKKPQIQATFWKCYKKTKNG